MNRKKILLGHLNSMGDCLFSTVIARQIKEVDYPNCHLTWAVNGKCSPAVLLNPYVDDVWEIPTEKSITSIEEWNGFVEEVKDKEKKGDFDAVFFTQIIGDNSFNYDGGIRSSTYNNYPHKITVSHQPIIRLSETEVENVRLFAEKHALGKYKQVILVECGPDSFSATLNPQSAYQLALEFTSKNSDIAFILSSNKDISSTQPNIIDACALTFRENAELTKYCDLFIGCASGISWLATSNWAKKLNMILVINQNHSVLPSMIYDHEYLNLPTGHIIEIKNGQDSVIKLKKCLSKVLDGDFSGARRIYNEKINPHNSFFLEYQIVSALRQLSFRRCFLGLIKNIKRNGILIFTVQFVRAIFNLQLLIMKKLLNNLRLTNY